ncbi:MAG TPA: alkaline phosphatase family protein [Burkholderiales bacterium]|nr:alkaline phosphatase family protein [Burkholderiales bacterium]
MRVLNKFFAAILTGMLFTPAPVFADHGNMPRLTHVFLIVMENHSLNEIIGNPYAPFINQLARSSNLAINYYAIGHPSLTNYLEIVGGSNFGIVNDYNPDWHNASPQSNRDRPIGSSGKDAPTPAQIAPFHIFLPEAPYVGRTIADQLAAAGSSWKTYQENVPASGEVDRVDYSDGVYSNLSAPAVVKPRYVQNLYVAKHNPFVYFAHIQENSGAVNGLRNVVGFSGMNGLYADLGSGKVPNFSFIVPSLCHDMHGLDNGSPLCSNKATLLQTGDATIKTLVTAIRGSSVWQQGNNVIIILWDENDYSDTPNRVAVIVNTNYGGKKRTSKQPYNHFSLLKTLETGFGLPCLNHACDKNVKVMDDLFDAYPAQY